VLRFVRRFIFCTTAVLMISTLSAFAWADEMKSQRQVDLEFEEVAGATSYEVELTSKISKKTLTFRMNIPHWKAEIKPGEYTLRLRSYDERGVPGDWSDPTPFVIKLAGPTLVTPEMNAEIKTKAPEKFDTTFKWQAVPGCLNYRVEVTALDPTGGAKTVVTENFKTNEGIISLPVASKFTWRVTPISNTGIDGESQDVPGAFALIGAEISSPEIDRPEDVYVQTLKWDKPKFADKFSYAIAHQKTPTEWERLELKKDFAGNEIPFSLKYPGGHYRLTVQATADLRENSQPVKIDFDVYAGDRSPATVEEAKLRQSLEKPTPWYFIASYMLSDIRYSGVNNQAGRSLSYADVGGTGRLGLGYISPTTDRGVLGIVDLSGYTVNGKPVTWASAEAHYVWRYTWGRNMIRPSAGVYYKELQETQNTVLSATDITQDKIAVAGPHIGFDFWHPFTSKIGMQINARVYYDAVKISTPNSEPINPQMSYLYGLMGSYKIKKNIMGFVGWAHRIDNASYKSTPFNSANPTQSVATPGDAQTLQITGDYFNLLLEWSF
jgi:hypothetical protein